MGEILRIANWTAGCLILYGNHTDGLVNVNGKHVDVRDGLAWGISRDTCYKYCGPELLQQVCADSIRRTNLLRLMTWCGFDLAQAIMLTRFAIDFQFQALCTSFH